jgi:hypothetical protein
VDGVALFSRSNANNTQAPLVPAKPDGTVVADAKAPVTLAKSGHAFNNGGDVATVEKAGDDPWLTREIAKLSPAEAQRTLSAVREIITHQQSMTDAAFKTWLAQNSTLLALYGGRPDLSATGGGGGVGLAALAGVSRHLLSAHASSAFFA